MNGQGVPDESMHHSDELGDTAEEITGGTAPHDRVITMAETRRRDTRRTD